MIMERLLSVPEAAELGTTTRFPRRLIAESGSDSCEWAGMCAFQSRQSRNLLKPGRCSQSLGPKCHDLAQASFRKHPAS